MKIAVCPGSFDPITYGHLDIVKRASRMFDRVIVAVLQNSAKHCVFSVAERVEMIEDSIRGLPNVTASSFDGLLADATPATYYVRTKNIPATVLPALYGEGELVLDKGAEAAYLVTYIGPQGLFEARRKAEALGGSVELTLRQLSE